MKVGPQQTQRKYPAPYGPSKILLQHTHTSSKEHIHQRNLESIEELKAKSHNHVAKHWTT